MIVQGLTMNDFVNSFPQDMKHVFLERDADTRYWLFHFSTSRQHLEEAVERVGHHVNAVANFLDRENWPASQ